MQQTKNGFLTSEFWLIALTVAMPYIEAAVHVAPATGGIVGPILAAVYAIGRTVLKHQEQRQQ